MMLEETIERVLPLIPIENMRIITSHSMSKFILKSMPGIKADNIISEPFGRNTCAAIGLAAIHLIKSDPHANMVVLSADHLIRPTEKLLKCLEGGAATSSAGGHLLTLGIVPTRPETGYGYIKVGDKFEHPSDQQVYFVSGFTEKPHVAVAKEYYFSGKYLWNSGMFIWTAEAFLKALEEHQPELHSLLLEYSEHIGKASEIEARMQLYTKAASISVDVAVLEKADNVLTIKADFIWDDVGDWNALGRYKERDKDSNVLIGDTITMDSYEMTLFNDSDGIVAVLGCSDLIVVRSGEITMVAHKTRAEDIKKLIAKLGENEETRKYL
jgi:mannose-1-phosphate guanylyltransferase